MSDIKTIYATNRNEWRAWLILNHDKEEKGIWLVFLKKGSHHESLKYEEAVEEALCFGWIDSIIKKINNERYVRKFSPRKPNSNWSELNKKRVVKVIKEGRMTEHGLNKINSAKKSGTYDNNNILDISNKVPKELKDALNKNRKANLFFNKLAPSYRKHFIGWIQTAKRQETKLKRVKESISLLEQGKKLGLK